MIVSYFFCFSCRHVAKERFSREVLQNENSNEVSRQSLWKCVRIFARTLRSCTVCAGQVHVHHARSHEISYDSSFRVPCKLVSRPKVRKFVRSFALHDVERKFVRIFVLQNLSSLFHTIRVNYYYYYYYLFIHILIGQSPQTQGLLTGYPKNESNAWRNRDGDAAVRISDGALFHLSAAK